MKAIEKRITTLVVDVGGVLLTNGWDRTMRKKAVEKFQLNEDAFSERHGLAFDIYEQGKLTLDQYLDYTIFYEKRAFTKEQFKEFMYAQSQPFSEMLHLIRDLKKEHQLKVVAITNEGKELMLHRIQEFKLKEFIDFIICSAFVKMRKPDPGIYQLLLDLPQIIPSQAIYIDDRQLLTEIGKQMGMHVIHHTNFEETKSVLKQLLI